METALTRRNKVFRELLPESGDLDMTAWNSIVRRTVESVIFNRETFDNTWDPFIKGMLYYLQGNSAAETEFGLALEDCCATPADVIARMSNTNKIPFFIDIRLPNKRKH